MIIRCEQCGTSYRLDESRIDKPVIKVRCAKCRHGFEVHRPLEEDGTLLLREEVATPQTTIIAVTNQKGGVAKTSTALNLGVSLALTGKRVLLVDFDVQANLTTSLNFNDTASFYDVLFADRRIEEIIEKTPYSNLSLLPSNDRMALLTTKYLYKKNYEFLLRDALRPVEGLYDFILVDPPPVLGFFTFNALVAATDVIIPTPCEYLSMHGIHKVQEIVEIIRRKTGRNVEFRVLLTMFDPESTVARVILSRLQRDFEGRLFATVIEYDRKMQESQIVHQPVHGYDATSTSARQYLALAKEILAGS